MEKEQTAAFSEAHSADTRKKVTLLAPKLNYKTKYEDADMNIRFVQPNE